MGYLKCTNFRSTFQDLPVFTADLSNWTVSSAKSMEQMFIGTEKFDSDLSGWDVSDVINYKSMFLQTGLFNSDISGWNVSSAIDLRSKFFRAESFNQELCPWGPILASGPDRQVENMFSGSVVQCESTEDPDLTATPPGPFCSICS